MKKILTIVCVCLVVAIAAVCIVSTNLNNAKNENAELTAANADQIGRAHV